MILQENIVGNGDQIEVTQSGTTTPLSGTSPPQKHFYRIIALPQS
jgi:hypothetical protein